MAGGPSDPVIMWFRRDLRLADNPALTAAAASGCPVVCVYIHDESPTIHRAVGGASLWWLDKSLKSLSKDIEDRGGKLLLRRGSAKDTLLAIAEELGAVGVFWNRRYGADEREIDADIKSELCKRNVCAQSFNGSLLTEPWIYKTGSGGHYKVFSPYWRAVQANYSPHAHLESPTQLSRCELPSDDVDDWALHPSKPDWSEGFSGHWTPGESGALSRLSAFLDGPVNSYSDDRNRPDLTSATSGLSPHLRFGEISPVTIWRTVQDAILSGQADEKNAMKFLSEVVWREFSYVLLFHHPELAAENYNPNFEHMPWRRDAAALHAWQRGQTGYPIVDAGMRQLWATGSMHNRVRMIVASFLTKHLLIHWSEGEKWFWDTLVDACPAANAASWQWTAGSGADAAPYFRVFNPITQGEKFDKTGDYVKTWCPELARLPRKFLYSPWTAPELVLKEAGVELGQNYPRPIVDHKEARARALEAYETMKQGRIAA